MRFGNRGRRKIVSLRVNACELAFEPRRSAALIRHVAGVDEDHAEAGGSMTLCSRRESLLKGCGEAAGGGAVDLGHGGQASEGLALEPQDSITGGLFLHVGAQQPNEAADHLAALPGVVGHGELPAHWGHALPEHPFDGLL
jgi:hypothetical protein